MRRDLVTPFSRVFRAWPRTHERGVGKDMRNTIPMPRRTRARLVLLERLVRHHSGLVCFIAVVVFVATGLALQMLRGDLVWWEDPLSYYLSGPNGWTLRYAYYGLSVSIGLLGAGMYCSLSPRARSAVPPVLMLVAGIALGITAATETDLPWLDTAQESRLHRVAALTTFLSVTIAMLLQSWRFRVDALWRRHFPSAFSLAVATFAALWVYAFWREAPEGLLQKTVICMTLWWLGVAAWRLRVAQAASLRLVPVRERGRPQGRGSGH